MARAKTLSLAEGGQPTVAIVRPDGASEVLREAAADLQAILERMIGMTPPMGADDDRAAPAGRSTIHLGETARARSLGLDAGEVGVEGYRIVGRGHDLFILGGSDAGTAYGVYGLLEDHLGCRFFMPGELFEEIPVRSTLRLAPIEEERRPGFLHRVFSGVAGLEGQEWERRNRISRQRPELPYRGFHHALYSIFPVARYGRTHPEYYALIDGERRIPESDAVSNAYFGQPCTTNPEVIAISVEAARRHFDDNPDAHCFSLGMNDNRNFCQCETCRALDEPGWEFRGRPVYSDRWFTYVNTVARALQETHPGKFVGCLAYINVEAPPRRIDRLEPNVAVYLTQDTSQHLDPAYRKADREFIRSWVEKCDHVCKYDYYGLGWVLPRYFPHLIAEDIRFQHEAGVNGFYAEVYPHWAAFGPQVWLASKLWWDPRQDPERLLEEFFARLYRGAAGGMRAFYDRLEQIWLRPRPGRWFQGLRGLHDQIPCYTIEDAEALEAQLARALAATRDAEVRQRIGYIRRWLAFPATLIRGWRGAERLLALPPGEAAPEAIRELRRLKARLPGAHRQAVTEDRWASKIAYYHDGRYRTRVVEPWEERIDRALAHAGEESAGH